MSFTRSWMVVLAGAWVVVIGLSAAALHTTTRQGKQIVRAVHQRTVAAGTPTAHHGLGDDASRRSTTDSSSIPAPRSSTVMRQGPTATLQPLSLRLLGTFVDERAGVSTAMIEDRQTGQRQSYAVSEMVQGWRLAEIARGYIVLDAGSTTQQVDLEEEPATPLTREPQPIAVDPSSAWAPVIEHLFPLERTLSADAAARVKEAITPVSETERLVNRRVALAAVQGNPWQVIREASMQPVFADGQLQGVRLATVPTGGVMERSGFHPGDVVRAVNDEPITNPALLMKWMTQLPQDDTLQVQIERNGQPITLIYRLQ